MLMSFQPNIQTCDKV